MPPSGTWVLAQTKRGIRRGKRPKKGRLGWKEVGGRGKDRPAEAAGRQGQLGRECDDWAAWCWHSDYTDYPLSSQRVASAGTGDFGFSDLGDGEPLPAPKPAPKKEEGSPAAGPVGVCSSGVWTCSLPPALSSIGVSGCQAASQEQPFGSHAWDDCAGNTPSATIPAKRPHVAAVRTGHAKATQTRASPTTALRLLPRPLGCKKKQRRQCWAEAPGHTLFRHPTWEGSLSAGHTNPLPGRAQSARGGS